MRKRVDKCTNHPMFTQALGNDCIPKACDIDYLSNIIISNSQTDK